MIFLWIIFFGISGWVIYSSRWVQFHLFYYSTKASFWGRCCRKLIYDDSGSNLLEMDNNNDNIIISWPDNFHLMRQIPTHFLQIIPDQFDQKVYSTGAHFSTIFQHLAQNSEIYTTDSNQELYELVSLIVFGSKDLATLVQIQLTNVKKDEAIPLDSYRILEFQRVIDRYHRQHRSESIACLLDWGQTHGHLITKGEFIIHLVNQLHFIYRLLTIQWKQLVVILLNNPTVCQKIFEELRELRELNWSEINRCRWLTWSVLETLRLYPVDRYWGRKVGSRSEIVITGHFLRHPKVFERPQDYRPQRWLTSLPETELASLLWGRADGKDFSLFLLKSLTAILILLIDGDSSSMSFTRLKPQHVGHLDPSRLYWKYNEVY